jgi:enoyl-CoA hydratase
VTFKHLLYDLTDGVATVTLNRPDVLNAINTPMRHDFYALVERLYEDDSRVVIFTGAGRAFSAGGDVSHFEREWRTPEFRAHGHRLSRFFDDLETLEKPVIAAMNGVATGAGLQLCMACDLRIASEEARLGFREHNLSLIPGHGGTARLVRLIGLSRAKELYFTGDLVSADEAHTMGLVNRVVPHDELMPTVTEMARKLARRAPQALGLTKRLLNAAAEVDTQSALFLESLAQSTLIKTDDHREGIRAFREKDKAKFTGS